MNQMNQLNQMVNSLTIDINAAPLYPPNPIITAPQNLYNPISTAPIYPPIPPYQTMCYTPSCGTPMAATPIDSEQKTEYNVTKHTNSTLILLDWDDTILPTTVIMNILGKTDSNGFCVMSDSDIELLEKLALLTLDFLTHLIKTYGSHNIFIITNSIDGWIKRSLEYATCISKTYVQIYTLLIDNNITMQSAKTLQSKTEKCPIAWKRKCFENILNGICKNKMQMSHKYVITIGDRWQDLQSAQQAMDKVKSYGLVHHMIKLKYHPSLMDMFNQIICVKQSFNTIFDMISVGPIGGNVVKPIVIIHDDADVDKFESMMGQIL